MNVQPPSPVVSIPFEPARESNAVAPFTIGRKISLLEREAIRRPWLMLVASAESRQAEVL